MNQSIEVEDKKTNFLSVYLLTFLLGWCTYSMKLVSIKKLIGDLSLEAYPPLMLVQGLVLYLSGKFLKRISEKSETLFFYVILFFGIFIISISNISTNIFPSKNIVTYFYCLVFILSTVMVLGIETIYNLYANEKVSVLQNPHVTDKMIFMFEIGLILGALQALIFKKYNISFSTYVALIPFLISIFVIAAGKIKSKEKIKKKEVKKAKALKLNNQRHPYLPYLVLLFIIFGICKNLQGFAMFLGIVKLKAESGQSVTELFSIISIIQTSIILCVLLPGVFKKKTSTSWGKGFDYIFSYQAVSMFLLSLFNPALALVSSGIFRKVVQHGFLGTSMILLDASLPKEYRLNIKITVQRLSFPISFIVLSLFSYLVIFKILPEGIIWFLTAVIAIFGIWVRKKLLISLNKFHIGKILKFQKEKISLNKELANSCYSLANKDAAKNNLTLLLVLTQNPPAYLKKSIIFALGEMKNDKSVKILKNTLKKSPREDIQLAIIQALKKINPDGLSLFYQKLYIDILTEDVETGKLRLSLCKAMFSYEPEVMVLTSLNLLSYYSDEYTVKGNILEALSFAPKKKWNLINEDIKGYLNPSYPIDIRINTCNTLYQMKFDQNKIIGILEELAKQSDGDKLGAFSFSAGNLRLYQLSSLVYNISEKRRHKNTTILLALLRLKHPQGIKLYIDQIFNSSAEEAVFSLQRFSREENIQLRYQTYFHILKYYSSRVPEFLQYLAETEKNFDEDIIVIEREYEKISDGAQERT